MKLKTLGDLKSRPWYRLLQVFYTIAFVLAIVLTIGITIAESITEGSRKEAEHTMVNCNNGNKYLLKDILNNVNTYSDYINIYEIKATCIRGLGADLYDYPITTHAKPKANSLLYPSLRSTITTPTEYVTEPTQTKNSEIDKMPQNYMIEWSYHSWALIVLLGFLILLAVIIVFEFIKRCFYYIILGKIFPPKGHLKEFDDELVCPTCNNAISQDDKFCEKCGKKTR
ncbi:MAG: zinc ribbon domain-containing protein [Patescibacteria group bacterium]|nr:zinc ribbon domain-containing protein [Patescibacteria group bacterium]